MSSQPAYSPLLLVQETGNGNTPAPPAPQLVPPVEGNYWYAGLSGKLGYIKETALSYLNPLATIAQVSSDCVSYFATTVKNDLYSGGYAVIQGTPQVLTAAAGKIWTAASVVNSLVNWNPHKSFCEDLHQFNTLTGDLPFYKNLIESLGGKLKKVLEEAVASNKESLPLIIANKLSINPEYVGNIASALAAKMFLHVALEAKKQQSQEKIDKNAPVELSDLFVVASQMLGEKLAAVEGKLQHLPENSSVLDLLFKVLSKGEVFFPVPVKENAENQAEDTLLSLGLDIVLKYYQVPASCAKYQKLKDKSPLLEDENKSIKLISDFVGLALAKKLPELLANEDITKSIAEAIGTFIFPVLAKEDDLYKTKRKMMIDWLSGEMIKGATSDHMALWEALAPIRHMSQNYFDNILIQLAKAARKKNPEGHLGYAILDLLMPLIKKFFVTSGEAIDILSQEPIENAPLIKALVKPLVEEIMGLAGIKAESPTSLEKHLEGWVAAAFAEVFAAHLANIKKLSDGYDALANAPAADQSKIVEGEIAGASELASQIVKTAGGVLAIKDNQKSFADAVTTLVSGMLHEIMSVDKAKEFSPEINGSLLQIAAFLGNSHSVPAKNVWHLLEGYLGNIFSGMAAYAGGENQGGLIAKMFMSGSKAFNEVIAHNIHPNNAASALPSHNGTISGVFKLLEWLKIPESYSKYEVLKKDKRLHHPKNQSLKFITDLAGLTIASSALNLLADEGKVKALAKGIVALLNLPEGFDKTDEEIVEWLTQQIVESAQKQDPALMKLLALIQDCAHTYLNYLFANLADQAHQQYPNEEVLFGIINMLAPEIHDFIINNEEEIIQLAKKPSKLPELKQLFRPLVDKIQMSAGMKIAKPTPFESLVDGLIVDAITDTLIGQLSFIKPLVAAHAHLTVPQAYEETAPKQAVEIVKKGVAEAEKALADPKTQEETSIFVTALLEKALLNCIPKDKVPAFSKQFNQWIAERLAAIGNTGDPRIKQMWACLEHLLIDQIANMAANVENGNSENIVTLLIDGALKAFGDIVEQNGPKLNSLYDALTAKGKNPADDPEFQNAFLPVCEAINQHLAGKKALFPKEGQAIIEQAVKGIVPKLLADGYKKSLAPQEATGAVIEQLEGLIDDLTVDKSTPQTTEETQAKSKVTSQFIVDLCDILGYKILPLIDEVAVNNFAKLLGKKELAKLNIDKLQGVKSAYLQKVVKSILLQAVVNYLQAMKDEKGTLKGAKLSAILSRITKTLNGHLLKDSETYIEASTILDDNKRKIALRKAFKPLAKDLLKLISSPKTKEAIGLPAIFPFSELLGELKFWDKLEDEILPDLFGEMLYDSSSWIQKIDSNIQAIEKRTKSTNVTEFSKELVDYITNLLPPALKLNKDSHVKAIYNDIKKFLRKTPGYEGKSVEEFLKAYGVQIKAEFGHCFYQALDNKTSIYPLLKGSTHKILQAVVLEVLNRVTKTADDINNPTSQLFQKDFVLKLGSQLLELATEHFKTMNDVMVKLNCSSGHDVPHEEYVKGFKEKGILNEFPPHTPLDDDTTMESRLEDAIITHKEMKALSIKLFNLRKELSKKPKPIRKKLIEREINDLRPKLAKLKKAYQDYKKGYFAQMGDKILAILDIKGPEDLPIHEAFRNDIWKVLRSELLPTMLSELFDSMLEPETVDRFAIDIVKKLQGVLEAEDERHQEFIRRHHDLKSTSMRLKQIYHVLKPSTRAKIDVEKLAQYIADLDKLMIRTDPVFYNDPNTTPEKADELNHKVNDHLQEINLMMQTFVDTHKPDANDQKKKKTLILCDFISDHMISMINKAIASNQVVTDFIATEIKISSDPNQAKLNQECGKLIKTLINMIPNSISHVLFADISPLKKMSEAMLGRALRRQLDNITPLQILDDLAKSGLTLINPAAVHPETLQELENAEMQKVRNAIEMEKNTKKELLKLSHKAIGKGIGNILKWPLLKLHELYQRLVDKLIKHPRARRAAYKFGEKMRYFLFGFWTQLIKVILKNKVVAKILGAPLAIPKFFIDLYLKYHINKAYKNIHLDIHDNLLFRISNKMMNELHKVKKPNLVLIS